ncbi:hypothetical protein [Agromyces indicus]|uniref:Uncharacterized protein n=1 Tax=Agromyces indicus TaxID=758919 RepID=A0ABU1FJI0_9MICO|nr:hypothetical protein [Agromyces indicus]MDR5691913.1 hypothetical protein [Agromyces indicus]
MAGRKHLIEVNRQVAAAGLDERGRHAALIGLARNLARRLDAQGAESAPLTLLKEYQSVLARLVRAEAAEAPAKPGRNAGEDHRLERPENVLELFLRRHRVRPQDRVPMTDEERAQLELDYVEAVERNLRRRGSG